MIAFVFGNPALMQVSFCNGGQRAKLQASSTGAESDSHGAVDLQELNQRRSLWKEDLSYLVKSRVLRRFAHLLSQKVMQKAAKGADASR